MLDSVENMEEYSKYETDYTHRLIAKYFSKNPYGSKQLLITYFVFSATYILNNAFVPI